MSTFLFCPSHCCPSTCFCVQIPLSLKRHRRVKHDWATKHSTVIGLGPTLIQDDLHVTWLHQQRPYFQIRSHPEVLRRSRLFYTWTWGRVGAGQDLIHNIPRHCWTVTPNEMRRLESINKPLAWHFLELSVIFFSPSFYHTAERVSWILVSPPGAKPASLAVEARSPNHWTTREFPTDNGFFIRLLFNRLVLLGHRELFCLLEGYPHWVSDKCICPS